MKKALLVILSLVLTLMLAACGKNAGGTNFLTIGTGGTGGTYYPLGVAMANIFTNQSENLRVNAVSTDASVANINGLADGSYQLALVQNDITYYADKGEEMFKGKRVRDLAGFGVLYPEVVQIVTTDTSGIRSVADLRGKRVAVGAAASGAEANARQILAAAGLTYDDIRVEYLAFNEAVQRMKDNNLDAAFVTAGTPTAAVQELGATRRVQLVPVTGEVADKLKKDYPFYTDVVIPANTYNGQTADVQTVAVSAMLVISGKVSTNVAYELAKLLYENTDELGKAHVRGNDIKIEQALDGMPIKLHPGVSRYLKEQGIE